MKKWILCTLLILGCVSAAQAGELEYVRVKPGDTLSALFREETAKACELNLELGRIKSKNCNQIRPGEELQRPVKLSAKRVERKMETVSTALLLTRRLQASTEYLDMFLWERVGGAPLRGCGKEDVATVKEKTWNALIKQGLLTEAERDELRKLTRGMTEPKIGHADDGTVQLLRGMRLESVTFCKDGQPVVKTNVKTAWDAGEAVYAQEFTLKSGKRVLWVRNCLNFATRPPLPRAPTLPAPSASAPTPPAPPASAPPAEVAPEPEPQEITPKEAVYRWDWELVVGKEYDRTAQSTFASGAVYGLLVNAPGGEHAFGLGGTYSSWHGKTETGFRFDGHLGGYGPAYKYSAYEGGWDFGLKVLPWASLTENGGQAAYNSRRHFDLNGITLAYNNYARELKGEKSLFKYQLFASVFKPTRGEAEHSVFNQSLPNADSRLDRVVNVGGRLGLYDFSQEDDRIGAKLWFAAGWFQEAPSLAETANWRFQLSDKHERVFFGLGRNYDLLHGGSLLGYGWSWDIRKTVYVHREETRRAQFVAAIEKAGGKLDKDGMVILPKGTKDSRQFKTAPSDD